MKAEAFGERLASVGEEPGVYLFRDAESRVVYVGKALSLRDRLRSYAPGMANLEKQNWIVEAAASLETIVTRSELEALMLEQTLIQEHRPRFNVSWRDNKSYPYLELTLADRYPRVYFTRRRARKGGKLWGPYMAGTARRLQRVINQYFRIPSCAVEMDGRQVPCLYHHLNWCDAPCAGRIQAAPYAELVGQVRHLLDGRAAEIAPRLEEAMQAAAIREDFEGAAHLRDRLQAIRDLGTDQAVIAPDERNADVVGLARSGSFACLVLLAVRAGRLVGKQEFTVRRAADIPDGELVASFLARHFGGPATPPERLLLPCEVEGRETLELYLAARREGGVALLTPKRGLNRELLELAEANAKASLVTRGRVGGDEAREQLACAAEVLGLGAPPARVEAVDLSHLHGQEAVGAVVVFRDGLPSTQEHRRYLIKMAKGGDDYASMGEVVSRRLRRLKDDGTPLPGLLLLDGGAGQLAAAQAACAAAGVSELPLVALAKREERLYLPGRPEPVALPADSPALHLFQRVRDEAHRYVNAYQRRRRTMALKAGAEASRRANRARVRAARATVVPAPVAA